MQERLLQTKLHIPPLRPSFVPRPHLEQLLDAGRGHRLILVSAPAGFGKTTLITAWLGQQSAATGWLSLEEADNHLQRFLTYFLAAIQKALPDFGRNLLRLLQSPEQEIAPEPILTAALNELAPLDSSLILILDDYQHIRSEPIQQALAFFLDHQPPNVQLVISTRSQPPLPLPRLRARGQLTQVDLDALRFTREEIDQFLRNLTNLQWSEAEVRQLARRTEGWPAGLQLAVLAMPPIAWQDAAYRARFIAAFGGSNRLVLDYLVDEVLKQQPAAVQDFLLRTAILDRFCAPLCDAVLKSEEGEAASSVSIQSMLEKLDTAHLFILPLDQERHWYRYHTMFAGLLRDRLARIYAHEIASLHRRASRWWAENGFPSEAIGHALAAGDTATAAHLIAQNAQEMILRGEVVDLADWLEALPPEELNANARLSLSLAFTRLLARTFTSLSDILGPLRQAEAKLQNVASADNDGLLAEINALRAVIFVELGQTVSGLELAEPAAAQLAEDRSPYGQYMTALLAATMALAYRDQGQTAAALQAYSAAAKNKDNIMVALFSTYERSKLHLEMGQLHLAETALHRAEDEVTALFGSGASALPLFGALHIGLGRLYYEWNRLDEARGRLEAGIELAGQRGGLGIERDGQLALAFVHQAQGREKEAQLLIAQAQDHARQSPRPDARLRAGAQQVKLWLAQGEIAAATRWAGAQTIDLENPAYPAEITAVALARFHLATERAEQVLVTLRPFLPLVEAGGRDGRLLEIWLLQALAYEQLDETDKALACLERCLSKAAPEKYVRLFLDAGQALAPLLYMAVQRGLSPDYSGRLLALLSQPASLLPQGANEALIEPLSARELEVLQLIAGGLTNRQVGLRLHLSPNTIKRHSLNIYEKLDVHSRTEAAAKARQLGILA